MTKQKEDKQISIDFPTRETGKYAPRPVIVCGTCGRVIVGADRNSVAYYRWGPAHDECLLR